MAVTFKTTIFQAEGKNATGIQVPTSAVEALGKGKRPAVVITINGYVYRSTIAAYGDVFLLPFSSDHRAASGLGAGSEVTVTLELDTEPRTTEVPDDLASALAEAGLRETFDNLSPSKHKEFVRQVEDAKTPETRTRRIATVISKVGAP